MRLFRQSVYAFVFYPATFLFVTGCFVASIFGSRQIRAVVRAWADFHHELARLLGTRVDVRGSIPTGALPHRREAPVDVRNAGNCPARENPSDCLKARTQPLAWIRLGNPPIWHHSRRSERRCQGPPGNACYGQGGGCDGKTRRHLSGGHPRPAWPHTATSGGICRPLQSSRSSGRSSSSRQRNPLGPQPSASGRHCAFPGRRADPGRPQTR